MGYTKFGEFLRILRIENHEIMGDMAKKIGVATSFLSAVENGKKNIPPDWEERIAQLYNLDDSQRKKLSSAIDDSRNQFKISLENAGQVQREAAVKFARSFNNMDNDTATRILELLNKNSKHGDDNNGF